MTGAFLDQHNGAVTAVATIFIAIFTVVLAVVTRRQAVITKDLVATTRNSAEALPTLERAYLFIEMAPYNTEILDRLRSDKQPRIDYIVKNYGKTPAVINEIFTRVISWHDLPEVRYEGLPDVFRDAVVAAGEVYPPDAKRGYWLTQCLDHTLNASEIKDLKEGKSYLWFYGRVKYRDIFSRQRETGFLWRYYVIGNGGLFHPYEHGNYNYRT